MEVFDAVESVVLAEADFRFTLMFYPIVTWIHLWRDCRKGKKTPLWLAYGMGISWYCFSLMDGKGNHTTLLLLPGLG